MAPWVHDRLHVVACSCVITPQSSIVGDIVEREYPIGSYSIISFYRYHSYHHSGECWPLLSNDQHMDLNESQWCSSKWQSHCWIRVSGIFVWRWANSGWYIPFTVASHATRCGGAVKQSNNLISFLHKLGYIYCIPQNSHSHYLLKMHSRDEKY